MPVAPAAQPFLDKSKGDLKQGIPLPEIPGLKPKESPVTTAVPSKPAPVRTGGGGAAFGAKADNEAKAAAGEAFRASQEENAAKVAGAAAEANAIESQLNERKLIAAKTQERVASAQAKFAQAQEAMNNIDTSVDPGRFWATRTTGDKVVGILGLVLGALGAGPDGVNRAAVMLNQAIDRDIDAQKSEHEMRLKKGAANVDAMKSYYSMAREAAGDELAATDLAHAAALQAVSARGKEMIAKTGNAQAKAQLAAFVAQVDQGAAQRQQQAWEKAQDRATELEKSLIAAGAKTPGGSAERQKLVDQVNESANNITRNASELKKLIDQYGTQEILTPGVSEDMQRRSTEIATELAKMLDPSTGVRDPEMERWSKLIFQPGYFQRSDNAKATLDNIIKDVEARRQNAMRVRGAQ